MRSFRFLCSRSSQLRELSRIWGLSQTQVLEDLVEMAYEWRRNRYFTIRNSIWVNQLRLQDSILTKPIIPTYHQEGDVLHLHVKVPTWLMPLRITKLKKVHPKSSAHMTQDELREIRELQRQMYELNK